MRQCPPHTSIFDYIKYAVQYLAPRIFPGSAYRFRLWQVWRNSQPFGIIKISRVGLL